MSGYIRVRFPDIDSLNGIFILVIKMIIVTVESDWNEGLKMSVNHKEIFKASSLDDMLDKIQDVYRYIFSRCDNEIRFLIEDNWIEVRTEEDKIYVYYHSTYNMFERVCTSCEIRILDDDTIYLMCLFRDKVVISLRLM